MPATVRSGSRTVADQAAVASPTGAETQEDKTVVPPDLQEPNLRIGPSDGEHQVSATTPLIAATSPSSGIIGDVQATDSKRFRWPLLGEQGVNPQQKFL